MMPRRARLTVFPMVAALTLCGASTSRADFAIYDGALGTLPSAQGWIYLTNPLFGALATQSVGGGVTTLDTTARTSDQAGYFSTGHPNVGILDRAVGFTINLRMRLVSESHVSGDRAGFSLIVLGSDAKGIELGFWQDQVWAQNDNPLFTKGEGAAFNTTTGLTDFGLTILGNSYSLSANGQSLFGGAVRDYSAFGAPYTSTNFLFMGDDTSSANARVEIARVGLAAVPEPSPLTLTGVGAFVLAAFRVQGRRRRTV
ncbi:MAG: hypothetical protein AB7I30_10030 [Isosphaeraceae bacterium]